MRYLLLILLLVFGCDLEASYNYPNPFNPNTTFGFYLSQEVELSIKIINDNYEEVKNIYSNEVFSPGYRNVIWDGNNDSANEASNGYYRIIYEVGTDECYVNIKKDSNN